MEGESDFCRYCYETAFGFTTS